MWNNDMRDASFRWLFILSGLVLGSFAVVYAGAVLTGFIEEDIREFVSYLTMLSPLLAALGFWKLNTTLSQRFPRIPANVLFGISVLVFWLGASIQLFLSQPHL
jgi:hypothetical protein